MNRRSKGDYTYQPVENPRNGWNKGQYSITEAEKMVIRAARKADWSYRSINRIIERSRTTIKRFCVREGIAAPVSDTLMKAALKRAEKQRTPLQPCAWCGEYYKPLAADKTPCCSRVCAGAWRSYQHKGPIVCCLQATSVRPIVAICIDCGIRFEKTNGNRGSKMRCETCQHERNKGSSRLSFHRNKRKRDKRDRSPRPCKECSKTFIPEYGNKRRSFCSMNCLHKYGRRIAKGSRRARIRNLSHESVNPIAVFIRDKWICQLCWIKTPRNKRGTFDDNAPELDHIVPLSMGGYHAWNNVQCLCRKCNIKKGASVQGQLRLAI